MFDVKIHIPPSIIQNPDGKLMIGMLPQTNTASPKLKQLELKQEPKFGNGPLKQAAKTVSLDSVEKLSQKLMENPKLEKWGSLNTKLWNLSLQDWSARVAILFAFYTPQTVLAFTDNKHKWETLSRNILNWTVTIGILILNKHHKYGLNSLFNPYLKPQQETLPKDAGKYKQWINKWSYKPELFDYASKKLGIDLTKWTGLDDNHFDELKAAWQKLDKLNQAKKLSKSEQYVHKNIPSLVNRISAYKFLSVGISVALLAFFVGKVVMDVVYKHIAPLDHDFDASKYANLGKKGKDKNRNTSLQQGPNIKRLPSRLIRTPSASQFGYPPSPTSINTRRFNKPLNPSSSTSRRAY